MQNYYAQRACCFVTIKNAFNFKALIIVLDHVILLLFVYGVASKLYL